MSCTHDGLGAIRVMRTCGMMGETVGRAAWIAVRHNTTPRGVYEDHLPLLKELIKQPGAMRRDSLTSDLKVPPGVKIVNRQGIDPADIDGIVVDDEEAKLTGEWRTDGKLPGFVGKGYRYSWGREASATYPVSVERRVPTTCESTGIRTTIEQNHFASSWSTPLGATKSPLIKRSVPRQNRIGFLSERFTSTETRPAPSNSRLKEPVALCILMQLS